MALFRNACASLQKRGVLKASNTCSAALDRLHAQCEVQDVGQPDDSKNDAGDPKVFPGHHEKSEAHQQRHGAYDGYLSRTQHGERFVKGEFIFY